MNRLREAAQSSAIVKQALHSPFGSPSGLKSPPSLQQLRVIARKNNLSPKLCGFPSYIHFKYITLELF